MEKRKKIAVLIDYDNFNREKYFPVLFEELNEIGDILIKYAFYSNLNDSTIKDKFIKHGIEPMSQIAYTKGKNAVDIRMAIEAMSLLEKDYIDCICLATSDSDFTPLVYELQKHNRYVIGAGDKANETYKNSFNSFISVDKITSRPSLKETDETKDVFVNLVKTINRIIESNHICFYCRDEDFKRVKNNPKKYIEMFKRSKGIIGLDFSVHTDMPLIKQKSQMNDNLSLTYFFGKSGVSIIPNIRYGLEDTKEDYLQTIPKGSLIAFGTYGFIKTIKEQNVWLGVILDVIKIVEPKGVIIYGSLPNDLKNWFHLHNIDLYIYPSYMETRMKEVKQNGN